MTEKQLRQAKARLDQLDTMTAREIKAQYEDLNVAEQIPRMLMYVDIGYLCGRIHRLEQILSDHQIEVPR